jgi:hypothetical protein
MTTYICPYSFALLGCSGLICNGRACVEDEVVCGELLDSCEIDDECKCYCQLFDHFIQ